jgi:hypothetical protein
MNMFKAVAERFKAWQAALRKRRVERLTARAAILEDGKTYDLLFLHRKGFVRARGTGQSITRIHGEIENRACGD